MKRTILLLISTILLFNIYPQTREFVFKRIADNLSFPEGPAWDGKENIYVSNCYSNWILKINNDKPDTFIIASNESVTFKKTNGLTVYKDGSIFACDYGQGAILKFSPEGKCDIVASGYKEKKFNRPNDLAFDPKGNLYFTDPKSYDKNNLDGSIYMIVQKTGEVKQLFTGLGFPNGIAFSPDAKSLFVCESAFQRILKFPLNEDGTLSKPDVFVEMPGGDPDGIAFDIDGNLYAAHFGGGAINVFNSSGKLLYKINTPGSKPSNIEFAGKDMKSLYITEDETNSVYKIEMDIQGLALFSSPSK